MYFNTCKHCGAHLDPGEKCDCKKEKEPFRANETTLSSASAPLNRNFIVTEKEASVKQSFSPDIARLLNALPWGEKNAVTRAELSRILGMRDRPLRELIERARREGAIIINRQNGRGYYLSDDLTDIERQYRADRARALSILARCKHMRRTLKAAGMEV